MSTFARPSSSPEVPAQHQAAATPAVAAPIVVAAYVPVGREPGGPDLLEALADALPARSRLLLPVLLDDGDLDWAAYEGPASLRQGPRGLREPAGPRLGVDAIREAVLVLVPALAVDRAGLRLGRGGGSYDRALARVTAALTVALLHDGEIVDSVPAEDHDRPVHATVTPRGGVTLSAPPEWTK
jgi:5-formyltetrahydrofolate cyclo-ligase